MGEKKKRRDVLTTALKDVFKDVEIEEPKEIEEIKVITKVENEIYIDDQKVNNFLIEKKLEILNIQANASLELGRIFEEVASNVLEKTYIKWLELNGYNRITAFRHRRRFRLYNQENNQKNKEIIARCTYREIDKIIQAENIYLKIMQESYDYIDFKEKFLREEEKSKIILPIDKKNDAFDNYQNLFGRLNGALGTLKKSEKKQIDKYLEKINQILKKAQY